MNYNTIFAQAVEGLHQFHPLDILRLLWMTFPLIPLFALMGVLLAKYLLKRDWSIGITCISHILQILWAAGITLIGSSLEGDYVFQLFDTEISIVFLFSRGKLFYLWAYMTPVIFSLFRLKTLKRFPLHIVFLFYLGGCSGLIATGDIFNFFVFYELMIMGAYVLISVNGEYGASVKYMIFGAASSAIFLAGIVVFYTSGAYFGLTFVESIAELPRYNITLALILFSVAFFIKGAFFPVSGWVAPCHSAANALVSSFLASYTIFTSMLGLHYLVLVPADALGAEGFFTLIRIMSLLTICASSIILFWEQSFKRSIAASTVFTLGVVGVLLSYRLNTQAGVYILIHAAYKSMLFYLYDDFSCRQDTVSLRLPHGIFLAIGILFAAGIPPAVTSFMKDEIAFYAPQWYKPILLASSTLIIGGFAKFRYRLSKQIGFSAVTVLPLLFLAGYSAGMVILQSLFLPPFPAVLPETFAALAALLFSRRIFTRYPSLHGIDRLTMYRNLNQELLLVLITLLFSALFLFFQ